MNAPAATLAAQILALRKPTLAELGLLIEAIESHVSDAPIKTQEFDLAWQLEQARLIAEYVEEEAEA